MAELSEIGKVYKQYLGWAYNNGCHAAVAGSFALMSALLNLTTDKDLVQVITLFGAALGTITAGRYLAAMSRCTSLASAMIPQLSKEDLQAIAERT